MTSDPSDIVERLVALIKGQTIPIQAPHDLADAIWRIDSKIPRSCDRRAAAAEDDTATGARATS